MAVVAWRCGAPLGGGVGSLPGGGNMHMTFTGEVCSWSYFNLAEILASTGWYRRAGGMAPPAIMGISARMNCLQGHVSYTYARPQLVYAKDRLPSPRPQQLLQHTVAAGAPQA